MTAETQRMLILIGVLLAINILTLLLYVIDKRKAINGSWRTPEAVLLAFSLFGGGLGGYIAMFLAHHKTRKWYFHLVNLLGIAVLSAIVVVGVMLIY